MAMKYFLTLVAWAKLTSATSQLFSTGGAICSNITIPVTITSNNAVIPSNVSLTELGSLINVIENLKFTSSLSGTFSIAATYCEPEVMVESRHNTLQLLVHGATYTRSYWFGDATPNNSFNGSRYSWVAYASSLGYPTLSIDRLGSGLSDHPDPILTVQVPAEVETIHQIVLSARRGMHPFPRKFNTIIYVGHSYGSVIGNLLNAKYPSDVNTTVLTGFSNAINVATLGIFATVGLAPAAYEEPFKFAQLPLGYLEATSKAAIRSLFWYGGYDVNLYNYDYVARGTISVGEIATLVSSISTAVSYTSGVMVITGQHDAIFCNPSGTIATPSDCGSHATGYLAQTKALYPSARDYQWYSPPNSGHCWQLHYDAEVTFRIAHAWLATQNMY